MTNKKNILAIIGSASAGSSNLKLVKWIQAFAEEKFNCTIFDKLSTLPHFSPELSVANTPGSIVTLREQINSADGIIICTPEYVFSIPSGLKNLIEWCVSTTIFSNKPTGLITASAHGQKGHEELQLIMKTIEAKFNADTALLIQGIKGKADEKGEITDVKTITELEKFVKKFDELVNNE
jgi:NAD(P)H-dependent FMN reductase